MSDYQSAIRRILVVAEITLREALRRRVIYFLLISGIIFIVSGTGCISTCRQLAPGPSQYQQPSQPSAPDDGIDLLYFPVEKPSLQPVQYRTLSSNLDLDSMLKTGLYGLLFAMISFWLYLTAAFFTPFLALNDMRTRSHISLLARPLRRDEYIIGKLTAVMALLALSMATLVICSLLALYIFSDLNGIGLLKGLPALAQGLLTYVTLLFVLSLLVGPLPALVLSAVISFLSFEPGILLVNNLLPDSISSAHGLFEYLRAYGLPQLGVNFLYGLHLVLSEQEVPIIKVGVNAGIHALIINLGWILLFFWSTLAIFRKKNLDT